MKLDRIPFTERPATSRAGTTVRFALLSVVMVGLSIFLIPVVNAGSIDKGLGDSTAGRAAISCGARFADRDTKPVGPYFAGNGVNIRTGPSTSCTSIGLGYLSHRVNYRCYGLGQSVSGWNTWTYLTDITTGKTGWVNDSLLDPNSGSRGSLVPCQ